MLAALALVLRPTAYLAPILAVEALLVVCILAMRMALNRQVCQCPSGLSVCEDVPAAGTSSGARLRMILGSPCSLLVVDNGNLELEVIQVMIACSPCFLVSTA